MVHIVSVPLAVFLTVSAYAETKPAKAAPVQEQKSVSCDQACEAGYVQYLQLLCGQREASEGCRKNYSDGYGAFVGRWKQICAAPKDPGSPFYQEQMDEYGQKCPIVEVGPAKLLEKTDWASLGAKGQQQTLSDIQAYQKGFAAASKLYQSLAKDAWTSKDFKNELNRGTVGLVPDFGTGRKAKITVREAIYLYNGPDAQKFLIGATSLKGKPNGGKLAYLEQLEKGNLSGDDKLLAEQRNLYLSEQAQKLLPNDHLKKGLKKAEQSAKQNAKLFEKGNAASAGDLDAVVGAGLPGAHPWWQTEKEAKAIAAEQNKVVASEQKQVSETAQLEKPAAGILDFSKIDTSKIDLLRRPCSYLDTACKIKKAGCADSDFSCRMKATFSLDGTNPVPQATNQMQPQSAPVKKKKFTENLSDRGGVSSGLNAAYDPASTRAWDAPGGARVTEFWNGDGLHRVTFSHGGQANGYESYVTVDSKHALQADAQDAMKWHVQPGAQLEIKSADGSPETWRLPSGVKSGAAIPKDKALSDKELSDLGFVKSSAAVAPKRLMPVAFGDFTEYKQADNGDIMGVAWTPAGGKDGGSYVQVRGGKGVKLEPTAASYLVRGPATITLKSPSADVKIISVPAGKVVEIDRNTKTAKDPVDAMDPNLKKYIDMAAKPMQVPINGFDIQPRCSGPECLDNK